VNKIFRRPVARAGLEVSPSSCAAVRRALPVFILSLGFNKFKIYIAGTDERRIFARVPAPPACSKPAAS
jgi:hypothetical protein